MNWVLHFAEGSVKVGWKPLLVLGRTSLPILARSFAYGELRFSPQTAH